MSFFISAGPLAANPAHSARMARTFRLRFIIHTLSCSINLFRDGKSVPFFYAQKKVCAPKVNCSRVIEQTALSETFVDHLCGPKTLTTSPLCELDCLCSYNYRRSSDQRRTCESTEAQTHAFKNVSRFKMARTRNNVQKRQKGGFRIID